MLNYTNKAEPTGNKSIWLNVRIYLKNGDCSSITEQIELNPFGYNDLYKPKLANRSFQPAVVTDSDVKFGLSNDFATNDNRTTSNKLCNLATVSKNP